MARSFLRLSDGCVSTIAAGLSGRSPKGSAVESIDWARSIRRPGICDQIYVHAAVRVKKTEAHASDVTVPHPH
jgi:hypothetical protein